MTAFKQIRDDQTGASSMIVVMIMAVIVAVMTLAFVRISVDETRDSTDTDLSNRAYYAAESGVEDARRAILENRAGVLSDSALNADVCDAPVGYDPVLSTPDEFDVEYTCMTIDDTPGVLTANLGSPNQTKMYDVRPFNPAGGTTSIDTVGLRWHLDADAASGGDGQVSGTGPILIRGASDYDLPAVGSWNFPALMKVVFVIHPDAGITRGDIDTVTVFISPTAPGGANGTSLTVYPAGVVNPAVDGQVLGADCIDNDGDMACSMDFDFGGLPAGDVMSIRITNLYASANFELSMTATNSDPLLFEGAQMVIDVTGRGGPVSRRVQAVVEVDDPDLLPDYTLQSALDICKDAAIGTLVTDFTGIDDTSCTQPGSSNYVP